ncbi:MAG: GatB/YqeY domain-containing protein [Actinomycetota bacterium]|nr:GatB/YqeY domain-containing protein [Acidimicrobiales bacterium]
MSLIKKIRSDMTDAMKAKNKLTVSTLRSVIAAVQQAEVAGSASSTLTDEEVLKVISAQAKRRVEAAEAFDAGNRPEQAEAERLELEILTTYLPTQLDESEVKIIVAETLAEGSFSSMKDMGAAMKAVNEKIDGRAEGRLIADLVKSELS